MSQTEFELGVKHGEYLAEAIIVVLALSGTGSAILGVVNTCKAANLVAKSYRRLNPSSEQLFSDSIDAINGIF
jgi:hypothetical protein